MREKWTGDLVGVMHNEQITQDDVAAELGIKKAYVSQILNGRRKPANIQQRMEAAVGRIIERRREEKTENIA